MVLGTNVKAGVIFQARVCESRGDPYEGMRAGVVLGARAESRYIVMANAGDSRAILAYDEVPSLPPPAQTSHPITTVVYSDEGAMVARMSKCKRRGICKFPMA